MSFNDSANQTIVLIIQNLKTKSKHQVERGKKWYEETGDVDD